MLMLLDLKLPILLIPRSWTKIRTGSSSLEGFYRMLHQATLRFWKKLAFRNPNCPDLTPAALRCLRWFLNSRHNSICQRERQPLVFRFQYRSSPKYQQYQKDADLNSEATHCVLFCIYRCKCPISPRIRQAWFPNSDDHCQIPQFLITIHTHKCPARFYKQSTLNSLSKQITRA